MGGDSNFFLSSESFANEHAVSFLAAEMRQNDKIACISGNRERRDRKNLCKAISDFQQSFQSPETRREFDLSDPLALKKDRPARQSDYDAWNTISGMQKFMGEDLNFHLRKNFQEEQNREWSLQQQKERMVGRENHKCAGNRTRDKWVSVLYQINPPKNKQTKKENKPTPVGFFLFHFCLLSLTDRLL